MVQLEIVDPLFWTKLWNIAKPPNTIEIKSAEISFSIRMQLISFWGHVLSILMYFCLFVKCILASLCIFVETFVKGMIVWGLYGLWAYPQYNVVLFFFLFVLMYDMIWYDMIWYDMIWYDMIWYDMIWYDMIWYDMIYRYDLPPCVLIKPNKQKTTTTTTNKQTNKQKTTTTTWFWVRKNSKSRFISKCMNMPERGMITIIFFKF